MTAEFKVGKTHITVTFAEQEVPLETLKEINEKCTSALTSNLEIILGIPAFIRYDMNVFTFDIEKL